LHFADFENCFRLTEPNHTFNIKGFVKKFEEICISPIMKRKLFLGNISLPDFIQLSRTYKIMLMISIQLNVLTKIQFLNYWLCSMQIFSVNLWGATNVLTNHSSQNSSSQTSLSSSCLVWSYYLSQTIIHLNWRCLTLIKLELKPQAKGPR
jgi:hypothetical protein